MKTMNKKMMRAMLFPLCALVAAALCGCASDDIETAAPNDQTAVKVTASVAKGEMVFTRGADALDDATSGFSLLTATNSASKINIRVDNGSGSYTNYAYNITGGTTITPPATPPYFPASVNSVNVYGWYPENGGSTSFTVQSNQQADADYCLSDVMIAQPTTSSRELTGSPATWDVTAAALSFTHIMSKVKVTLAPVAGVTITGVVLKNVKKTVALETTGSPVVTSVAAGSASGDASDITLLSGGSITSASTSAQKTLCGVFPAQTLSGSFLTITASYGGLSNTITYSLAASKNFAKNQQYNITATIGIIRTDETVSVTGWSADDTSPVEISVGSITDPAAMRTGDCLKLNPLYWVAQYNVKTIKGVTDYTLATPAAAAGTTMWTYHQVGGTNVFNFTDAGKTATGQTGKMDDYHLPTFKEQISVIPSDKTTGSGANIFGQNNTSAASPYIMTQVECTVHGTNTGNGTKSYFLKNAALDYYAVRFVDIGGSGSDYASAWHYKQIPGSGLLIESYMLATKPTTDAQAKEILAALPATTVWDGTANEAPAASGTSTTSSLARRFLPACGCKAGSSGIAGQCVGTHGYFWSSSADSSNGFRWNFDSGGFLLEGSDSQSHGYSVRLFRDN